MPARLVLAASPERVDGSGAWTDTGPAVRSWFLHALEEFSPALSALVHDPSTSVRPYSLTPLLRPREGRIGDSWSIEVGVLDDSLTAPIAQAVDAAEALRVAGNRFEVTGVNRAQRSYKHLVESAQPATCWEVRFLSPSTFNSSPALGPRRSLAVPDASQIFGRLHRRWRQFSDVMVPGGFVPFVDRHIAPDRFALRSQPFLVKGKDQRLVGAIGFIEYVAVGTDDTQLEHLRTMSTLVEFAEFCGIGDQTAFGMGHVMTRAVVEHRRRLRHRPVV